MEAKLNCLMFFWGGVHGAVFPTTTWSYRINLLMEVWGDGGRKNGFGSGLAYEVSGGMNPQEAGAGHWLNTWCLASKYTW